MNTPLTPEAHQLLAFLHRGGKYGYYWVASEAKDEKHEPVEKLTRWYPSGELPTLPVDQNGHGPRHLYHGVHPVLHIPQERRNKKGETYKPKPEKVRPKIEEIAAINCLFGEFDEDAPPREVAPSVCIASSKGKTHEYWLLDEPFILDTPEKRDYAKRLQAAWVRFIGSDDDAKDLTRVLRTPGTVNYKAAYGPNYPTVTVLEADYTRLYSIDELAALCAAFIASERTETRGEGNAAPRKSEREYAERYLSRLDTGRADRYHDWLAVGMALTPLGLHGLALWEDWSQNSAKYKPGECEYKWHTFDTDPHGIAKLGAWANEDDPGGKAQRRTQHQSTEQPASDSPPVLIVPTSDLAPPLAPGAVLPAELGVDASPWLDRYIAFSEHWSPRSYEGFHEGAALWTLSTIAARRVALHFGGERYTNLSIAFCARTSMYAKSTAARIASEVLEAASLTYLLAADDSTPQAFIRALTQRVPEGFTECDQGKQAYIKRKLAFAAQRGWFYDEFGQKVASMMREGGFMADFRGLLRRFDDCPARYEYATIGRGNDEVQRPYLALLANLTPADLKPFAKKGSALWNDGFWARFAFITPPAGTPRNEGEFPEGQRIIPDALTRPLYRWHARLGIPDVALAERKNEKGDGTGFYDVRVEELPPQVCTLGDGIKEAFYRYHDALLDAAAQNDNQDLDGSYARLAEKALRIAMLLASLENDGRIELAHFARAQQITERWRANLHHLINQLTDDEPTVERTAEDKIIALLRRNDEPLTARDIGRGIRELSAAEAEDYLSRLAKVGIVEVIPSAKTKRYQLSAQEKNNCRHVNTVDVSTASKSVDTRHNTERKTSDNDVSTVLEGYDSIRHVDTSTPEELSSTEPRDTGEQVLTPVDTSTPGKSLTTAERLQRVNEHQLQRRAASSHHKEELQ